MRTTIFRGFSAACSINFRHLTTLSVLNALVGCTATIKTLYYRLLLLGTRWQALHFCVTPVRRTAFDHRLVCSDTGITSGCRHVLYERGLLSNSRHSPRALRGVKHNLGMTISAELSMCHALPPNTAPSGRRIPPFRTASHFHLGLVNLSTSATDDLDLYGVGGLSHYSNSNARSRAEF